MNSHQRWQQRYRTRLIGHLTGFPRASLGLMTAAAPLACATNAPPRNFRKKQEHIKNI
jgi:hypothetical protein